MVSACMEITTTRDIARQILDTEVSVSKNSVNDMLTRQKILSLLPAVEDSKTHRIDKTA
jgi:hypothetical protein